MITQKVAEKLLEKPYAFPEMIRVLKDAKKGDGDTQYLPSSTEEKGAGVTQYLPSSPEEMMEKLALLCGELSAGNTTVLPHFSHF